MIGRSRAKAPGARVIDADPFARRQGLEMARYLHMAFQEQLDAGSSRSIKLLGSWWHDGRHPRHPTDLW